MSQTYVNALIRGVILAGIAAGAAFFSTLGVVDDATTEQAAIVAGGAFFSVLAGRFGGEGTVDNGSAVQRSADAAKATPNE